MVSLHIAVDAHWLIGSPQMGVSTYLRTLLSEWAQGEDALELDLLVPRLPEQTGDPMFSSRKVRWLCPPRVQNPIARYRAQLRWQQITIPALLRKNPPDVYFSPFHMTPQLPLGVAMVTTIHDLCFLAEPFFSLGSFVHRAQLWSACVRAKRLICISQHTHHEFSRWSPRFARKAEMVYNGIETRTLPRDEACARVARLGADLAPQKYLLWVGSPCDRKNMELLFGIFKEHHRCFPAHRFVVVTPPETHEAMHLLAQASGLLPALHLFSNLDDPTRDALYRCALAFVFPSKCEGFGYPTLEALSQGCPSFSLRGTAMQELLEGVMPLAPEPTVPAFMDVMAPFVTLPEADREQLRVKLISRAAGFSAKTMAAKTLDVLYRAASVGKTYSNRCHV